MELLRRVREPVTIGLLIVSGLRLLVGIVAVPVLAGDDAYGSFATAANFEADRTFDVLLLVVTAVAAGSCLLAPPTARAHALVIAAVVVITVAVLVALGYGLVGLTSRSPGRGVEFGYLLFGLVLPVLAVIGLLSALRASVPRPLPSGAGQPLPEQPAPPSVPQPPPALPAAWQPEQATGRVWTTAGEAAQGAPGAGWPSAESVGWQPIPGPDDRPPADRS